MRFIIWRFYFGPVQKLNVLQLLPENVIEEIGRHATTKSFAANRPGALEQ